MPNALFNGDWMCIPTMAWSIWTTSLASVKDANRGNASSDGSVSEDELPERVRMIVESAPEGADMERPCAQVSAHPRCGRPYF